MQHCENNVTEMLDSLEENEYNDKHSIYITVNGKTLKIDLMAQIHQDFMYFLQQVKEESEL